MKVMTKHLQLRSIFVILAVAMALSPGRIVLHRGEGVADRRANTVLQCRRKFARGKPDYFDRYYSRSGRRRFQRRRQDGSGHQRIRPDSFSFSKISIWFGDGLGSFENVISFHGKWREYLDLDAGNLNNDGRLDLLGSGNGIGGPGVGFVALFGNGDGTFQAVNTMLSNFPGFAASLVEDLNDDGRDDAIIASQIDNSVYVALSGSNGEFGALVKYQLPTTPTTMAAGDFNGDGKRRPGDGEFKFAYADFAHQQRFWRFQRRSRSGRGAEITIRSPPETSMATAKPTS